MALQLFPQPPPLGEFSTPLRELVGAGALIQRELITHSTLETCARERGIPGFDRDMLEAWDRDGVFSPLVFCCGGWTSWRTVAPYPLDGIVFREDEDFRPWSDYEFEQHGHPRVNALYSEWQLLYLAHAREGETLEVPVETFKAGGEAIATFAANHQPFVEQHLTLRGALDRQWLGTVKALLRLQARYWPFVHGESVLLWDDQNEHVDALDLEYDRTDTDALRTELGLNDETVEASYHWLARSAQWIDPLPGLYDVRRFQLRRERERERGQSRRALDFYDAAEIFRRAYRELTGTLLPDADQLQAAEASPRPFGRDRDQLGEALRGHELYPHSLHIVVEGETEMCLIKQLFEAFAGRAWDGAGLLMTNLGGDKLEGSRTMLEGFSAYADAVALLLDNENDAARVTRRLSQDGVLRREHVQLWERSLEEDNFTPQELLDMVAVIGAKDGAVLDLNEATLLDAQKSRNQGRPQPKGLGSILQELARSPDHGSVVFSKPQLAEQMAELIEKDIAAAPGRHDEVGARRPIVRWVLDYPVSSYRRART